MTVKMFVFGRYSRIILYYVCMYVCMYICMYVNMYVCVCMYICMYVNMYVCVCMYEYVCMYVCTTTEIIHQIHELILEDRRISAKSVAEQLGTSCERLGSIIQEGLNMRKLSAKLVPKCLNAVQKPQRCQSSELNLDFFSARSK